MLNKRGQLEAMIMFFGTLVLVGTVLFSFATFNNDAKIENKNLENLISEYQFKQKYTQIVFRDMVEEAIIFANESDDFENEFKIGLKKFAKKRRNPEISNLFAKIINEPLKLNKGEGIYSLIVEEVFVGFEKGKNSIERKFNLEIKFDEVEIISQSL
jgi:hypothetical protein|tara:strand:- start:1094 stop:1564 length:471 start_codon:yes stop_codon:yes gene_type:complete